MRQTSISGTARMLDPILELRGGSVYYPGGKQALKQVSAAFYPGEKTAVIGNNGAGKSTFSRLLTGLYLWMRESFTVTEGSVQAAGRIFWS